MIQDGRTSCLSYQQIGHLVAEKHHSHQLLRGYSNGCSNQALSTLHVQYESPVSSIREEALDSMLALFCEAKEPAQLQGLQIAVMDQGAAVLKSICTAISQSADSSRRRSTDDMLSVSVYEVKKGADVCHSLLLAVPPSAVTKLVPTKTEPALHKVLLKTLMFLPQAASPCLGALHALLMLHTQQRADFFHSDGAAKLCKLLGECALPDNGIQRGMELLCTLVWQLRRSGEADLEAVLMAAAKEIHLNACSVLAQFAGIPQLSEHALAQTVAQLLALL